MYRIKDRKTQIKTILILSILGFSSIYMNYAMVAMVNSDASLELDNNFNMPKTNEVSLSEWWNASYFYRKLINITNPNAVDLTDFTTYTTFNYTDLVSQGHMNLSLYDIRIVENGVLRDYYYRIDYPSVDYATVWFKTNCSSSSTEYDTFLYYGNNSVGLAESYYMSQNPEGLVWYSFDDDDTGVIVDKLANYNATTYNNPNHVTGKVGDYSLSFNGNNQYLGIQGKNYNTVGALDEFTIGLWFKTSFSGGSYNSNWAFFDFDRSEYFNFFIRPDTTEHEGKLGFSTTRSGIDDFYSTTGGFNDGEWHYAVAVYDGTNKYIYIDPSSGQPDATSLNSHSGLAIGSGTSRYGIIGDGSEATSLGTPRNNIYYQGEMDEIRYYERALTGQEIEWLFKDYKISTSLNEEQEQLAQVIFTIYDVDGRIVPNAEISLINATDGSLVSIQNTSSDGSTSFNQLVYGSYNITMNYSLNSGLESVIYDSTLSKYGGPVQFTLSGLYHSFDITVDLWTIDFEIVDWDENPITHGYIEISNDSSSSVFETLQLDSAGKSVFRWHNRASYYYKVFYQNADYNPTNTPLNASDIYRTSYTSSQKYYSQNININETNIASAGFFSIKESIFSGGSSTELSNKKILKANITLSNMVDHLDSVKIYYINADNETFTSTPGDHLIFQNTSYGVSDTTDFIQIDMRNPTESSAPLIGDDYEVYGLYMEVDGTNATQCNGTIQIDTLETQNVYNKTALAKINIRIVDEPPSRDPVTDVIVHVFNGSISDSNSIANLTTDQDGYAYGAQNPDIGFWYLRGTSYNFTIEFFGTQNKQFNVNYTSPSQWMPTAVTEYNYTLESESSIIFELIFDSSNYITQFQTSYGDTEVDWKEFVTYSVNFTYSTNGGSNWNPINSTDGIQLIIKDFDGLPVLYKTLQALGNGNFSVTFNSSILSAGYDGTIYTIEITGEKPGYGSPDIETYVLQLLATPTSSNLHNYGNPTQTLTKITQYYNELTNITVSYFPTLSPTSLLRNAILSYSWDYGSGINIGEDPINPGYYSFELNTSTALTTGTYSIDIGIELENYTRSIFSILIDIIPRFTTLNDTSTLYHVSADGWIKDAFNFTLEYRDVTGTTDARVGDLEQAYYYWYQLAEDGTPVGSPSSNIDLVENGDSLYVLDFDTETRDIGKYAIFVTLQKNNYDARNAFINLEIKKRTIDHDLSATGLSGSRINVIQGAEITITLDLSDESRNLADLTNATVKLTIGSTSYSFTESGNGIYELIFPTESIDAFIAPQTLLGSIEISKTDYVTETISLTLVIGMPEIFGFPMFYFLMIIGALIAVVGSLVTYRMIQRARIPTFVKKVREMSKNIKGRKSISDSLLYPSKEEFIVKKLGDRWEVLGLSLDDILGIETKRKKKLPETTDFEGGKM